MAGKLLVSTRKGLFTIEDKSGWQITDTAFLGDNVSLALHDTRNNYQYAALDHGHFGVKLHRRKPGEDWMEIATPAYPPKPEDLVEADGWGKELPWTVMRIWALEAGGADQPGLLWCGTIPGALFVSHDHGDSWEWVKSLWDHPSRKRWFGGGADWPGIHSVCVDPRDSNTVRLGVSCGGVWRTTDCGKSWDLTADGMRAEFMPPDQAGDPEIQDPHFLAQCRNEPDRLWVQHHNGIFRSDDAAENWTEIEDVKPSGFGFPVVVHPKDGDTAWFVPGIKDEKRYPVDASLVVTRTRDGGKTFDILHEGLPQKHAYDVVLRHALSLDETGDCLAFGSTTGSLWASKNQGENWTEICHTLPPVYAVRWC
ncbi:MAG: exo-alpha-sialidase [Pseudomonadota bacterium]